MLEKSVTKIVSELTSIDGERFFASILKAISKEVGSDHIFVAEVDPDYVTAVTVSHVHKLELSDNFSYELLNTPCAKVTENNVCYHNGDVQSLFPEDFLLVAMGINSYVGAPLLNSEGKIHGIIVAMFQEKMNNAELVVSLFKLFSGLLSGELERSIAKKRLQINEVVFNSLDEGVIVTNAQKQIEYVNPAFCKIYGYSKEEVLGNEPGNLLRSGEQDKAFYQSMWQEISEKGSWSGKIINKKKSGEHFTEWLKINKAKDQKSGSVYYVGIFHEVLNNKN